MKIKINLYIFFITLFALFFSTAVNAQGDGTKTKTVQVEKGGNLIMKVQYGDLIVSTWDKSEVFVKYEYDEDTGDAVSIEKDGNTVKITSNYQANSDTYEITVPSAFNINLSTQGGDIDLKDNLTGNTSVSTSGGDITLQNIIGDVKVSTAGGDIKTGNLDGKVTLNTAGGDIEVGSVGYGSINTAGGSIRVKDSKKSLKVHTAGGNIEVGNVGAEVEVLTGGGNIEVGNAKGDATIKTGGGNISLDGAAGKTNVKTGGGNIDLNNIKGSVDAKSGSGNVKLKLNPSGNSTVKTAYGNITLYLPADVKTTVIASVRSSGWMDESNKEESDITSDFPSTTFNKRSSGLEAVYQINGGGSKIELITQSGEIAIKKQNK